jgi:hypothetical protein
MDAEEAARLAVGEVKAIETGNHRQAGGKPTTPDDVPGMIKAILDRVPETPEARHEVTHSGFDAVLFMAENGFRFLAMHEDNKTVQKWGENRENFTNDISVLTDWHKNGFKRFLCIPWLNNFLWFDIDLNHADGRDGLADFYEVMEAAGKPRMALPSYLQDIPNSFPCHTETPSGGIHLPFKYSGPCKEAFLKSGEAKIEVKYFAAGIACGEKPKGPYVLHGNPMDAPDLPAFLVELLNPAPKAYPRRFTRQYSDKGHSLDKLGDKVCMSVSGHNERQKNFAWRAAYFGYTLDETITFVLNNPADFGEDSDTVRVVTKAWSTNAGRAGGAA